MRLGSLGSIAGATGHSLQSDHVVTQSMDDVFYRKRSL
jgi:hypothetical protein